MLLNCTIRFVATYRWRVLLISLLLLIPVFWHPHIEAGDLPSHTYNAWLAQLIERGQAPGLYTVSQWNNVLVDITLLRLGDLFGLRAAERIVVSACVLTFFWGAFALVSAAGLRPPWFLTPAIAMISFGYTFYMGFFNFYWALGFGFFVVALVWRGNRVDWLAAAPLAILSLIAHPMGFLCTIGIAAYFRISMYLRGLLRWLIFAAAISAIFAVHFYVLRLPTELWDTPDFYKMNGSDQLAVFSPRYSWLALAAFLYGVFCALYGIIREWKTSNTRWSFRSPLELWVVLLFAAAMVPESITLPHWAAAASLIIARTTSISAVLALAVIASVKPRKWHLAGFGALAAVFLMWTYQDTGVRSRMEKRMYALTRTLPYGQRVISTVSPAVSSRNPFLDHMVDRACIGHCFGYQNYEPSTLQFRIRVKADSPVVTSSAIASRAMEWGQYTVQKKDLPISQIYQCDENDFTRLCIRSLSPGEQNGRIGRRFLLAPKLTPVLW